MADPYIEHSFNCMVEKVSKYAIFLLDCDGVVLTWNPAAAAIKGYEKEEIIGRPFSVLYTEEARRDGHPGHNLEKASEHGTFEEEAWRVRKDGSLFWALVEIIAIRNADGQLTGFCKLTRDISRRRRIETALRDADRRKDEFLAMLAHELRNPLAPVSAAAALLATGRLDRAAAGKASQVISRQVKHMTELVDDLLDISRVSRGEITLAMAPLNMKNVVNSAIEQARPLVESRDHTLAITMAPAKVNVLGDEKRLIQVVANLLNNSAKYTPPGGAIGLHLCARQELVCVEVTDNGQGIAPEVQGAIFDMFEQVQRTSDRTTGGLGIGLALVRSIIQLHGGTVGCHSDGLGQGSQFSICLPRIALIPGEPLQERVHPSPGSQEEATRLSILIVDDNVDAAEMLEFFLKADGHHVVIAHTARDAMKSITISVPDACILDIGLPDSTGHDLAARIGQATSPPPVLIALTGYSMTSDRDDAANSGFDHFFVKPADLNELTHVLGRIKPRAVAL